jgi:hypothetical protein
MLPNTDTGLDDGFDEDAADVAPHIDVGVL